MLAATYANLGSAYSDLGDYAKSRASFEQAIRLNPNQASAWQGMALVCEKQGNLEEAIGYFAHLVELQPSGQGYLQLAKALAQANRRAEAVAAYEQALRMEPNLIELQHAAEELPGQH